MSKNHLYLPKLHSGASISEPGVNGLWEDKTKKILKAISDGIELDKGAETRGVSSIPDIFARPLMFLGALNSDQHPLHKRVVQEWRGMLSLLALHKVKKDLNNLKIEPVILNDEKFSIALKNLAPEAVRLQKNGPAYSYTDILIIKLGDIPIGSFSPSTLVYTASDYHEALRFANFSLTDNEGYLKPPGPKEGLDQVQIWVEAFQKKFTDHSQKSDTDKDYGFIDTLNTLLNNWLKEINKELNDIGENNRLPNVKIAPEPEPIHGTPRFLGDYSIYKELLTPLVVDDTSVGNQHQSDYALDLFNPLLSRNVSDFKEIIVIDERQLSIPEKQLWPGLYPAQLGSYAELKERVFNKAWGKSITSSTNLTDGNAIWIRPELYFLTDALIKDKSDDFLNESESALNAGNAHYLLPFKKEILLFFNPEQIKSVLNPHFIEKDNQVIFCFTLPLVYNQKVEVKKTYRLKSPDIYNGEGFIKEIDVPILEIFPNYLGDFWCQYFMLYSDTDRYVINPLNYDTNIDIDVREQKFEQDTTTTIKAEILRITGNKCFPEAVEIKEKNSVGNVLGIVLIRKDEDIKRKQFEGRCKIGIDFGTSNTNIFKFIEGEEKASKWKFSFSKYVRSILGPAKKATGEISEKQRKRLAFSRMFFAPAEDQELPIPTALRIFRPGFTEFIMLDQFIYFPDASRYPKNVYTDIKWDDDNTKMESFLKSLIFLLMIDLVMDREFAGKIEFFCSFPKSFTDYKIGVYKTKWNQILENLFYVQIGDQKSKIEPQNFIFTTENGLVDKNNDYYSLTTDKNGNLTVYTKPQFSTEGIAAGEYFSSYNIPTPVGIKPKYADKVDGSVCIDVGGGTCDYSIWFGSKILLDASVHLAGRQISKLLKNNSRVRDILLSTEAALALNEVRGNDKNNDALFTSRLNFILRAEEKSIISKLSSNANNKDIAWLKRILAIEFGALSFYAGHLCVALDNFTDHKLAEKVNEKGINLHWGGNAAKFINWIDHGRYEEDGIASTFLNGMFGNVIADDSLGEKAFNPIVLGQVPSPGHKAEASGGLVVMNFDAYKPKLNLKSDQGFFSKVQNSFIKVGRPNDKDNGNDQGANELLQGLILGEQITVNGKSYQPYEVLDKNDFFHDNSSLFNSSDLSQLDRFIFLVNYFGKETGLFPEGFKIELTLEDRLGIKQRLRSDMATLAALKPDQRVIEPIFIMEVNYLLDILSMKIL